MTLNVRNVNRWLPHCDARMSAVAYGSLSELSVAVAFSGNVDQIK